MKVNHLAILLSIVLLAVGCSQKYVVLKESSMPNPPERKIKVELVSHARGGEEIPSLSNYLMKDEVPIAVGTNRGEDIRKIPTIIVKNPFKPVYESADLRIDVYLLPGVDSPLPGEPVEFKFRIEVSDSNTKEKFYDKEHIRYFLPGFSDDTKDTALIKFILGALLETSIF
jgi:hypothetical protein